MARIESQALGGFYPSPPHLIPAIATALDFEQSCIRSYKLMDPCAGEGAAILQLGSIWGVDTIYTCELENQRSLVLERSNKVRHVQGDAFLLEPSSGVDVLYLNPPYDTDSEFGRLEEKFLQRFTTFLSVDGILIFVVPYYALKASAETLAAYYTDVACVRFPDVDFEVYKQVVLYARRREEDDVLPVDPKVLVDVERWASSADTIPVMGQTKLSYSVNASYSRLEWKLSKLDLLGLTSKAKVWRYTSKLGVTEQLTHVLPDLPAEDLLYRSYEVATLPRPAHIATGIASGLFNGRLITAKGQPSLLVKGVFDREYVTVDEKETEDGATLTQVQEPKLVVTTLNLETSAYETLSVEGLQRLLDVYGESLMRVMAIQCPAKYVPSRDAESLPLKVTGRTLYRAQEDASKAIVQLLGGVSATAKARRYRSALLLGEIGSGKTSCALTVSNTISKRTLVICPPHLLQSWKDEAAKVVPGALVRVLENVADVDTLAALEDDRLVVAILSREAAKLSHGWEGASHCPKCGEAAPPSAMVVKKRLRCETTRRIPKDHVARAVFQLALKLAPCAPDNVRIESLFRGRALAKALTRYQAAEEKKPWGGLSQPWVGDLILHFVQLVLKTATYEVEKMSKVLLPLLLINYKPERVLKALEMLGDGNEYYLTTLRRTLSYLLPIETQNAYRAEHNLKYTYGSSNDEVVRLQSDEGLTTTVGALRWDGQQFTLNGQLSSSVEFAARLLAALSKYATFRTTLVCGEPLYQAVSPQRYALSKYIVRRHPRLFDFFVLDEGHEAATDGSAQERSAHAISNLGIPSLYMTGSVMNGYARSLFTNMWYLSANFRREFNRDEAQKFVNRYGYRKRIVQTDAPSTVVEFGSHSDRVVKSERMVGDSAGVLPLFLFRHLLGISVTLHKADLALDLPPCRQIVKKVLPSPELFSAYQELKDALVQQIRDDRFEKDKAGKLFGALAEFPSYLDRASNDTGNQEDGSFAICYPESVGGALVCKGKSFKAGAISAKEAWMLATIKAELAEGRNVMVLTWHLNLLPRLAKLIENELAEPVAVLHAVKVPTGKRQAWIDKNIVQAKRRVLVVNPVCIQTGLNNLVWFSSQLWMENPAVNPVIFRQGVGRVDRIGQDKETRIYTPIYEGTLQEQMHDLLLRKVAVSISTDGLDAESVLRATGALQDGYVTGMTLGRQLWKLLQEAA